LNGLVNQYFGQKEGLRQVVYFGPQKQTKKIAFKTDSRIVQKHAQDLD
jgi:hypothetical protein